MKKIIVIAVLLALFGCSQSKEAKEGVLGEKVVVEDLLSYEINRFEAVKKIEPSIPAGYYSYREPGDKANVLLDLVLKVKNESTSEIKVKDYISSAFEINDKEYETGIRVESDGGTDISAYGTIDPMKSTLVHLYIEIAEADIPDEVLCKLTINKETTELNLNKTKLVPEKTYLKFGKTVDKKDTASVKFIESSVTKKLIPPNPGMFYTYYKVDDNADSYLVVKMNVKNTGENDLSLNETIGCKAKVDNKYDYSGQLVWEDSDGSRLTDSGKLEPLKKTNAYCLIQVPDEIIKKPAEFKIHVLDDIYYIKK